MVKKFRDMKVKFDLLEVVKILLIIGAIAAAYFDGMSEMRGLIEEIRSTGKVQGQQIIYIDKQVTINMENIKEVKETMVEHLIGANRGTP